MLDWGYGNPGVCLWATLGAGPLEGHLYIRHEYVFQRTLASEVAKECARRTLAMGIPRVLYCVADPDIFNKKGHVGEDIPQTFARYKFPLRRADNQRVIGWQRVRHWLNIAPDGLPWLLIDPSCAYLIRTLIGVVNDKQKPEDIDPDSDDHPLDALRYGLMSHRPPLEATVEPPPPPGSAGALIAQAMLGRRRLGSEPLTGRRA